MKEILPFVFVVTPMACLTFFISAWFLSSILKEIAKEWRR